VKIAIAGALGRMGRAVAAACEGRDDVTVVARYERPGVEGEGLVSLDEALGLADAVIDFTTPEASVALAEKAAGRGGVALVIGSTGLSQDQTRRIDEAAKYAPLEQLALSPQCGFSSTVHGNNIAVEDQKRKLQLVVEVANEVWG
jgi:dihydrodipicolinate reductase